MHLHHLATISLGASVLGFLEHWSGVFQSVAALCAIVAYGVAAYKALKKK